MKIVKPMAVSFSFRTFLVVQKQELCVTSLVGFALGAGAPRLVSEIVLWPAIGEATGGVVDEGLPKARGEVLVHGSCHTPGGVPLPATMVRVCIARADAPPEQPALVDKKLAVFGDRYWAGTAVRAGTTERIPTSSKATEPVPFTEMPLGWERAFGGPSYAKNPLGRGIDRIDAGDGSERVPLPNVELVTSLVSSSSQHPEPAGLGPLDLSWPQRQSQAGTYGRKWLEEDFPGFAPDTNPAFFSTAQPDQRIDGFFRGDEEYVLENLHPTHSVLRGRLPGAAARVLVRRKGSQDVEDVRMTLDTLVLLPDREIGILVFRGLTPIVEDDASDIAVALAACEDLDAPRPIEHYVAALDGRLDKDESPLLALNEDDLVPSFAAGSGLAELIGKFEDPTALIRERTLKRVRQQLVEEGVEDPDAALAKAMERSPLEQRLERLPDPTDPKDLAEYAGALEVLEAYAENKIDEARQTADKLLDEARQEGLSLPEAATQEGESATGTGPPTPQTPQTLELFRQAGMEPDPSLVKKLQQTDAMELATYRESAHYMPPARRLDGDARDRARHAVTELRAQGQSFAARDWTRFDLSALDLDKADLRQTLLEGADLTKTNLAGADLAGAVLAHAALTGTCLDGATLEGTNLGATVVDGASFAGANLRKAVFARSQLVSASFKGADVTDADWLEANLGTVDFEAAIAPETTFLPQMKMDLPKKDAPKEDPVPSDLTRCRFPGAKLKKANFLYAKLDGVDFAGADLELVTFLSVSADGANFRGASLRSLHAVMGCSFVGASFEGADLTGAFLRGANLRGANFEGARLEGADLSECDLTGANLSEAQAKQILLMRADLTNANLLGANLMEAMMQKSKWHGADLSKTNLFAANLGLIRLDTATKVHGANLKRALMLPKARKTT
jgi:uncharacterized protein YjbI with pentapeptide repeats